MARVEDPRLPSPAIGGVERWAGTVQQYLNVYLRRISNQLNNLADGYVTAATSADSAAPSGGTWSAGDYVRNTAPAEAGSAGSMYVITGWIYDGTSWIECRSLTGN